MICVFVKFCWLNNLSDFCPPLSLFIYHYIGHIGKKLVTSFLTDINILHMFCQGGKDELIPKYITQVLQFKPT